MKITIELKDWEEEIMEFIKEGYEEHTGDEVSYEDVLHGIFEFFVIAKTQEELPDHILEKAQVH